MGVVTIPYTQYLRGYNDAEHNNMTRQSQNRYFISPQRLLKTRENGNDYPVYEIHSYDFDRWGVFHSHTSEIGRSGNFTQYIAFDGSKLAANSDKIDMDGLRRSAMQLIDPGHGLYFDSQYYEKIAKSNEREVLPQGEVKIRDEGRKIVPSDWDTAYLVMRIWENCWENICAEKDKRQIQMPHRINLCFAEAPHDPVKAGVEVLKNWLGCVLPPQVMSMISVTVGATAGVTTWNDSACRILIDDKNKLNNQQQAAIFELGDVRNGIPASVTAPANSQAIMADYRKIVTCIQKDTLPVYFDFIERAMRENRCASANPAFTGENHIMMRADFELLYLCARIEVALLDIPEEEFGYDEFIGANEDIFDLKKILHEDYHLNITDIHMLLRDMELKLAERAAKYMPFEETEYRDLACIFKEVESTDDELAAKLLSMLGNQYRFAVLDDNNELTDGSFIREDEELAAIGRLYRAVNAAEILDELDGLRLDRAGFERWTGMYRTIEDSGNKEALEKLNTELSKCLRFDDAGPEPLIIAVENELNLVAAGIVKGLTLELDGTQLDRAGFEHWVGLYGIVERFGKDGALERLNTQLSKCLRFSDEGPSPIVIAENNDLSIVVTGIVRGMIADLARSTGKLTHADYMQVLELYTDYSNRLNAEASAQASEMLCAQARFADSEELAADILAQKDLTENWNSCVKNECDAVRSRNAMIDDEEFELWTGRMAYESIDDDVLQAVIEMVVANTPREKAKEYIIAAAEGELSGLEERFIARQLELSAEADNLMTTDDFKWWIDRYNDAQQNAKPFDEAVFGMLKQVRLREKEIDILDTVRECGQWRLLGALVVREAPAVKALNSERYDKWIGIYNDLQNADSDVDREAIRVCENLLNQRITYETIKQLEAVRDQGGLFWNALKTLADNQLNSTANMKVEDFEGWLRYLQEAENEGNPVARDIRSMLNVQCRLRDSENSGTKLAYDAALAAKCTDTQLLIELIRTEYTATIGENGVRNMANLERWLDIYKYLNVQGDKFAEEVGAKLCEKAKIEGAYVLDVAVNKNADELAQALIATELKELPETNSLRDIEALRRWLKHYKSVRAIGDENMENDIGEKITQRPILDGQYVLGIVLAEGGEDLEEKMLECEKNAVRAYTAEEYEQRLNSYFAGHFSEMYLELLTGKGTRTENLERLLSYLKKNNLGSERVHSGGVLLGRLTGNSGRFSADIVADFHAVCDTETGKGILRENQSVVEQILTQSVDDGMTMRDMQCFYVLRDADLERLPKLDSRAIEELADAIVAGDTAYDVNCFVSYFKNGVQEDVAGRVHNAVSQRLASCRVDNAALENAVRIVGEVHMPAVNAVDIVGTVLNKSTGKIDINVPVNFVSGREKQLQENMTSHVAAWLRTAEDQSADVLDAVIAFTKKMQGDSVEKLSGELFDGVCKYLANGNSCVDAEEKTYDRMLELWGSVHGFNGIRLPMLNSCTALAEARTAFVRGELAKGPFYVEDKYNAIAETRDNIELTAMKEVLRASGSVQEFAEAAANLPWLDDEVFDTLAANEEIAGGITAIAEDELARKIEEQRVNGSRLPVLNGMCDMAAMLDGLNTKRSINACLSGCFNKAIDKRVKNAFDECVKIFDAKDVAETTAALGQLRELLMRIGADANREISPATIDWCESFANAAVRSSGDGKLIRDIHANRRDFDALKLFVSRVYDGYLSRESFTVEQMTVLLAAAKVLSINDVWTRYICMAARMPQDKNNIWQPGHEVAVVMHVVLVYDKLDEYGDDVISKVSLADYCAADDTFADQQKKQKNRELKAILDRGRKEEDKPGLFGRLFGRK